MTAPSRARQETIFARLSQPTLLDGLRTGDVWYDITNNIWKYCTSTTPITFVNIAGGGLTLVSNTIVSGGTVVNAGTTIEENGSSVGSSAVLDFSGDDEIQLRVSLNASGDAVVRPDASELMEKFRALLRFVAERFNEIPEGLEEDFEMAVNE